MHTYVKKKEDYLDIALTTGTAQNMNNTTGNLDFDIGSTDDEVLHIKNNYLSYIQTSSYS